MDSGDKQIRGTSRMAKYMHKREELFAMFPGLLQLHNTARSSRVATEKTQNAVMQRCTMTTGEYYSKDLGLECYITTITFQFLSSRTMSGLQP